VAKKPNLSESEEADDQRSITQPEEPVTSQDVAAAAVAGDVEATFDAFDALVRTEIMDRMAGDEKPAEGEEADGEDPEQQGN
jgi:hypothetical protein